MNLCFEDLIRQARLILQEEKTILASSDDCNYFRALHRTSKSLPPPPAPILLPPPSLPQQVKPEPVVPAEAVMAPPTRPKEVANNRLNEIQKNLTKAFPHLSILSDIPSDAKAKSLAERWKTKNQSAPISILSFHEMEPQQQFLTHLTKAIEVCFGNARLITAAEIEKENQWEPFLSVPDIKLVIICDYALWQMPNLLKFYREVPSLSQRFLLDVPLMLLTDLTLYFKDPLLKRSLWKAICQKLA